MFKTRLISGICLVIIAVALIVTGGNVLLAALAAISLIGMFELYRVVGICLLYTSISYRIRR